MARKHRKHKSKKSKCINVKIVGFRTEFGFPPLAFKPFPHLGERANRGRLDFPPIGFVGQGRGHEDLTVPFPLAFGSDAYLAADRFSRKVRPEQARGVFDLLSQLQINVAFSPRQMLYP